jgi:hypothetical protein
MRALLERVDALAQAKWAVVSGTAVLRTIYLDLPSMEQLISFYFSPSHAKGI